MPRAAAGPVRIVMHHPGLMGSFGYAQVESLTLRQRRLALGRAGRALGWLYVIRKLNALYVLNRRRNPTFAARLLQDREYASAKHRAELSRAGLF